MNKICEIMILSCSFKHSPMTIRVIHGINCGHFFKMLILIAALVIFSPQFKKIS